MTTLIMALTFNMFTMQKPKKIVKAETISRQIEWNIKCLNAEKSYEDSKNLKKIKVAVLDSGLDYDVDLPAVEKKDFLGQGELHPLYQDMTGHGTSVASLICARKNEDRITGIAANVELYIGRIFGAGNDAPVDRVVRAINWAISEKVNIIHMSFGTQEYSEELENAIEKAYKSGILIIAAAGNEGPAPEDESTIEYPAAFDNVISVGATNKYNNMANFSSTGTELDVVAPGNQILTDGAFGGVSVDNGTSISAAQVTGMAAVLWGKHPDKSNEFIKNLLVGSANKDAVNSEKCGQGMVDYEEAEKNYNEMNQAYKEYKLEGNSEKKAAEKAGEDLPDNTKNINEHRKVNYVNASWKQEAHEYIVENGNKNGTSEGYIKNGNINYVKMGAVHSDNYDTWKQMSKNPYFHGRGNYFVNTHYLYCTAKKYINKIASFPSKQELKVNGHELKQSNIKAISSKLKKELGNYFNSFQDDKYFKKYSEEVCKKIVTDTETQGYVLLGAAIHNLTDTFSHNVYKKTLNKYGGVWCPTVHAQKDTAKKWNNRVIASKDPSEKSYLHYLLKNFAISDIIADGSSSVHLEKMYQLASKAGACMIASISSKKGWYNLLKPALQKPGTGKLRLNHVNKQWNLLTGKDIKFKKLSVGKNNEKEKVICSYKLHSYKINSYKKRYIQINVKQAYGHSVSLRGISVYNEKKKKYLIEPSKLKGAKINISSYWGTKAQNKKISVQFKIKYSCKGMKNIKLINRNTNKTQIAKIGTDVTFLPKKAIFKKTKGKKTFRGWSYKKNSNKTDIQIKKNKKPSPQKYPTDKMEITLYPVFK